MTSLPLADDAPAPSIDTGTIAAAAITPLRPRSGLAAAGLIYCLVEVASAWGWLHWRADLPALAPSLTVTTLMRGLMLLLFVSAIAQTSMRIAERPRACDAACVGAAALLMHAPWTLIVVKWPHFTWLWLAGMSVTAVAACAKLGRDHLSSALIAAPYTGWLVAALYVETVTRGPFG